MLVISVGYREERKVDQGVEAGSQRVGVGRGAMHGSQEDRGIRGSGFYRGICMKRLDTVFSM
jgi:hypothetical protein